MSKEHAEHNEKICSKLLEEKQFFDWVVTTAFYSSLHYVEYQLFPLIIGEVTYPSFNHYYDSVLKRNHRINKHDGKAKLVNTKLSCGSKYRWLLDACSNARYIDYQIDEEIAKTSKECLDTIKACVTKP